MSETVQIDAIDRRILAELQADAAISHADLAQRVGSSSASVWRRIRAMESAGLLRGAIRTVDAARLGYGVNVICNIRVRSHSAEDRASFESFVRSRPEILECFSMSGEWDYLLRVVARDVADYNEFLMGKMLKHPAVASASSNFALQTIKFTTAVPV